MATEKDHALVDFLLKATESGQVRWEATAFPAQFTTSLKGKYNVTIDRSTRDGDDYWLTMNDSNGRELLRVTVFENGSLVNIFHSAQRKALKVDSAIDEILGTASSDEDVPF